MAYCQKNCLTGKSIPKTSIGMGIDAIAESSCQAFPTPLLWHFRHMADQKCEE
jgi:hypothetical protein